MHFGRRGDALGDPLQHAAEVHEPQHDQHDAHRKLERETDPGRARGGSPIRIIGFDVTPIRVGETADYLGFA